MAMESFVVPAVHGDVSDVDYNDTCTCFNHVSSYHSTVLISVDYAALCRSGHTLGVCGSAGL